MIDKITPRALDKSSDYKLVPKTSMIDALNVFITDDNVDEEGNAGVLKNIKGNHNILYATEEDRPQYSSVALKVIGSVTDTKTQICYFFVWSQQPSDHGIWAYDKYGKLPISKFDPQGEPNTLRKIYTSAQFNFPEHGFVKGDVVYTNTNEFEKHKKIENYLNQNKNLKVDFEKDALLYFTDYNNEPRKINAYRALLDKSDDFQGYTAFDTADLICACPKVALERITFEFSADPNVSVNNFVATPGFQFAYQKIYKDGMESAISTYSTIAFPPSVIHRGAAQEGNILAHNLCTLTVPRMGKEIENIRILARYGNTANFFEIDEVGNLESNTENWDPVNRTYKFYNDRVASGVSPQEVDKTFDNLPRKAQAQTAIANRLVYGNYLEGYDNVDTECESTVIYNERPQDYLDLTLKAHPAVEPSSWGDNKCVGFQIDTTEIPNQIAAGTTINVSLDYTPDRNFHIYQADSTRLNDTPHVPVDEEEFLPNGTRVAESYHQSRQTGAYSANAVGYRHWPLTQANNFFYENGEGDDQEGANNTHELTAADAQEKGASNLEGQPEGGTQDRWKGESESGGTFLRRTGELFFGQNFGVGSENDFEGANLPKWRVTNSLIEEDGANYTGADGSDLIESEGNNARYGTSAGNPLIIKGMPLHFKVKFTIIEDVLYDGKKVVGKTVAEALAGSNGTAIIAGGTGVFSYNDVIDIDVENDVKNTVRITKAQYDLGLGHNPYAFSDSTFSFPKITPGKPLSYLICGVGDIGTADVRNGVDFQWGLAIAQRQIPFGYFIINRAEVDFYLEQVTTDIHTDETHLRLAISKIDVDEEDIMTCWKRLDPTSPWWAIHPSTIKSPQFYGNFDGLTNDNQWDILWDTVENEGTPDNDNWQSSVPYKFRLPSPVLQEGRPGVTQGDFANIVYPREWFIARFTTANGAADFDVDEDFADGHRFVNLGFCGYLDISDNSLFKPHNPDGEDYIPKRGQNKFRFSIMDGEGGPGGSSAGGGTAYDNYGNSKYGSIAARVDFGYDGASVVLNRTKVHDNDVYNYQALVGGSRANDDGSLQDNGLIGNTPQGASSSMGGLLGLQEHPLYEGVYHEPYVVSGPFFTGCIAMNPVVGEVPDAANPQGRNPFPPVKDYTTTLPLVWVNSQGRELGDASEIPKNWLKTSYPWPQVIKPPTPQPWIDNVGLIANGEVDPTPFFNPQNYEPGQSGVGTPQDMDVPNDSPPATNAFGSVDFSLYHSHIEGNTQSSFVHGGDQGYMSFKSSATHEMGIVYYDERGRHGYVNHLDSVYVKGYSDQDRGDANSQGSAHILLKLLHNPPEWAHNYKIVYSKNTSVSDFIQYSAGGAFVAEGDSAAGDPSRIYVSLNYLQGHTISYSSAWGARSQEGSMVLYTPKDGDRLRVISYMLPPDSDAVPTRIFPTNYDFEVSGVVSLDNSDENPLRLSEDGVVVYPENRQGLFLKLKNNSGANGFRYQDIRDGSHNWGDNCLVEIYSPVKELHSDDRLYYEIGDTYRTVRTEDGLLLHEVNDILLTEGDVYFRSAAVNFRDYNNGTQSYEDIIIDDDLSDPAFDYNNFVASEANFKSYYIESPAATDLFKSDGLSIGRPNIIKHDAQEAYKEASVIHSDRDITDARKVSYSAFNRSIPIDKDLDLKSGGINYLANHNENCFFIQKDKCGYIPIDRSIISDVEGETSLIASSKFLNTPKYYAGRAGADGNPESVVSIDNTSYFAHKSLGEVYRVSGVNGVNVISENNMTSYFRELFKDAINQSMYNGEDVRVVGGYDPVKNEYLVTVLDPVTYGLDKDPDFPDQPVDDPIISDIVLGCTDPMATNYDPQATHNDGSCKYPAPVLGCMDPRATNYKPEATVSDGSCIYPPPLDIATEYTGDPCDYPGIIGPNGAVNSFSIMAAWSGFLNSGSYLELGITNEEASLIFPNVQGGDTINTDDFQLLLSMYGALAFDCNEDEGDEDSEDDPGYKVDLKWLKNNPTFESERYYSALYVGNEYPPIIVGENVINQYEPGQLHPTSALPSPKIFSVVVNDVGFIQEGQSVEITVSIPELEESITYTDQMTNFMYESAGYQGDDIETLFNFGDELSLGAAFDDFGTVETITPGLKYKIIFSGDIIQASRPSGERDRNNPGYRVEDDEFEVFFNVYSPWGQQGWLNGALGAFYPQPENVAQGMNEDVSRVNTLKVDVNYVEINNPSTSTACTLNSNIGWINEDPDRASNVVTSKQLVEPLLFTGNLCDYPALINYVLEQNPNATVINLSQTLIQDYYNFICAQIYDPENPLTANEATYLFPNFPGALGAGPDNYPAGNANQWFNYFVENNGMGDLNLDDYEIGQGIEWYDPISYPDTSGNFTGLDFYALWGWMGYIAGETFTSAWNTIDILDYCEIATQYNNNPCDYPLIINDQGIIDIDSITAAWEEVAEMVSEGGLSITLATELFPDVNGNGFFDSNDQNLALTTDVILGVGTTNTVNNTLFCDQNPCPYTGNPCDYPMLIDNFFMSPTLGMITGDSMSQAAHVIFGQMNSGELNAISATCYWPDIYENDYISIADLVYTLPGLPYDCTEGGEPPPEGPEKPVKPSKEDLVKPALRTKVAERRKKNKEDKENY